MECMLEEDVKVDVLVRVYPAYRSQDPLLALPLHSNVLSARSSFFAACLSQRWQSAAQPLSSNTSTDYSTDADADSELFAIDIVAPRSSDALMYKRCIDLMYVQRKDIIILWRPFLGVDDALHMLHIATELLFEDCMDACMQYLDMLCSWTPNEEASIRAALSALQLSHIHPDLARRLSLPHAVLADEPTLILRRMLVHALQVSTNNLRALDPAKPIEETSILQAWNTHFNIVRKAIAKKSKRPWESIPVKDANMAISRLLWLFNVLLVLQAAESVVRVVANDTSLSTTLIGFFNADYSFHFTDSQLALKVLSLLIDVVRSVVNGQVLLSQAARLSLTEAWLPVCDTKLILQKSEFVNLMMSLLGSLPVVDREQFYKDCLRPDLQGEKDLLSSFRSWVGTLRETHTHLGGGHNIVLVSEDAR